MFGDTASAQYRIRKDAIAVAMKDADHCGIKVAELNMFNVLDGLDVLLSKEPEYILLRDKRIFVSPMERYDDIKNKLRFKIGGLTSILQNR